MKTSLWIIWVEGSKIVALGRKGSRLFFFFKSQKGLDVLLRPRIAFQSVLSSIGPENPNKHSSIISPIADSHIEPRSRPDWLAGGKIKLVDG